MNIQAETLTAFAKGRSQYSSGKNSLRREYPWSEADRIGQETPELESLLEPLFRTDAQAESVFNKGRMKFAGIARELLLFGAEYGNPRYAILGARIYQKLGKGDRPFVLNAVRRSLENMQVSKETKRNYLDILGSGIVTQITYSDLVANGHRIFEEEVIQAQEYLASCSQPSIQEVIK